MSFKKLNNMIKTIEEARRNIKSNVSWGMNATCNVNGLHGGLNMIKVVGVRLKSW